MEDEYFVNYNELIDKIVNNNLSLQKYPIKRDMSLGQKFLIVKRKLKRSNQ